MSRVRKVVVVAATIVAVLVGTAGTASALSVVRVTPGATVNAPAASVHGLLNAWDHVLAAPADPPLIVLVATP